MSGIRALGYIVVQGPVEEWTSFATDVLGAQVARHTADEVRLRTDERSWRIAIESGPAAGPGSLVALGFEVESAGALSELADSLTACGIDVRVDDELARHRQVRSLIAFSDNDGHPLEAYYGQEIDHNPFVSPRGVDFVTGDLGVGHAFLFSGAQDKVVEFFTQRLGFRLSDTIDLGVAEGVFLHCNPRHHSVAVAEIPDIPVGFGHLMLEVGSLEAVGLALDIATERGDQIQMSMGKHTNDHVTSFYVTTPSGFQIEYGWNGLLIDDTEWTVGHHVASSIWGHKFNAPFVDVDVDVDAT
jgi:3,4-dihydroxy-9,10-secoandrosta-1,3,5(10)-triene-9,17-dione 4,5-dioxygenase